MANIKLNTHKVAGIKVGINMSTQLLSKLLMADKVTGTTICADRVKELIYDAIQAVDTTPVMENPERTGFLSADLLSVFGDKAKSISHVMKSVVASATDKLNTIVNDLKVKVDGVKEVMVVDPAKWFMGLNLLREDEVFSPYSNRTHRGRVSIGIRYPSPHSFRFFILKCVSLRTIKKRIWKLNLSEAEKELLYGLYKDMQEGLVAMHGDLEIVANVLDGSDYDGDTLFRVFDEILVNTVIGSGLKPVSVKTGSWPSVDKAPVEFDAVTGNRAIWGLVTSSMLEIGKLTNAISFLVAPSLMGNEVSKKVRRAYKDAYVDIFGMGGKEDYVSPLTTYVNSGGFNEVFVGPEEVRAVAAAIKAAAPTWKNIQLAALDINFVGANLQEANIDSVKKVIDIDVDFLQRVTIYRSMFKAKSDVTSEFDYSEVKEIVSKDGKVLGVNIIDAFRPFQAFAFEVAQKKLAQVQSEYESLINDENIRVERASKAAQIESILKVRYVYSSVVDFDYELGRLNKAYYEAERAITVNHANSKIAEILTAEKKREVRAKFAPLYEEFENKVRNFANDHGVSSEMIAAYLYLKTDIGSNKIFGKVFADEIFNLYAKKFSK